MTAQAPEMPAPGRSTRFRYRANKSAGLCTRAKSHGPAAPGHVICAGCLTDDRLDRRDRNLERNPARKTRTCHRCGEHGDGHNARGCTNDPLPGWTGTDPRRLARHKRRNTRHRAEGLCIVNPAHQRPENGKSRCEPCLAKNRKAKS